MPTLKFKSSSGKELTVEIDEEVNDVTIGRSQGNNIRITNPSISRQHARIVYDGVLCTVFDAGSSNGVFVNDERVRSRTLYNGDRLRCGDFPFLFEDDSPDAQPPEPKPDPEPILAELESEKTSRERLESDLEEARQNLKTLQERFDALPIQDPDTIRELSQKAEHLDQKTTELSQERDKLQAERDGLHTQHSELLEKHESLQANLESLRQEHSALQETETQRNSLQDELQNVQTQLESLQQDLSQERTQHSELLEELSSTTSQLDSLREALTTLQSEHNSLQDDRDALQNDRDSLREAHASLQTTLQDSQLQHASLQEQLSSLQASNKTTQDSHSSTQAALDASQQALETLRQDLSQERTRHSELLEEHNTLQTELERTRSTLHNERDALQDQLETVQTTLHTAHEQLTALQSERDSLQNRLQLLQNNQELSQDEHQSLSSQHSELLEETHRLKTQNKELQDQKSVLEEDFKQLIHEHKTLQNERDSLHTQTEELNTQYTTLHSDYQNLLQTHNDDSQNLESFLQQREALSQDYASLQTQHTSLKEQLNALQNAFDRLNEDHLASLQLREQLQADLSSTLRERDALSTALRNSKGQHLTLLNPLQDELQRTQGERDHLRAELDRAHNELAKSLPSDTLAEDLQTAQQRIQHLETQLAAQRTGEHTPPSPTDLDELQTLRSEEAAWRAREIILQELLDTREHEISSLRDAHQEALEKLQTPSDNLLRVQNERDHLQTELNRLRQTVRPAPPLAEFHTDLTPSEIQSLQDERDQLQTELQHLRASQTTTPTPKPNTTHSPPPTVQPSALSDFLTQHHLPPLPQHSLRLLCATLNAGRHLLLTGSDTQQLSSFAHALSSFALEHNLSQGSLHTHAHPSWTLEDTLGTPSNTPPSHGLVLQAIASQKWLVLDSLQHAHIPSTLEPLFPALRGLPTDYPRLSQNGSTLRLSPHPTDHPDQLTLPPTFRIVAICDERALHTLPTHLFSLFTTLHIQPPSPAQHLPTLLHTHPLREHITSPLTDLLAITDLLSIPDLHTILTLLQASHSLAPNTPPLDLLAETLSSILPSKLHTNPTQNSPELIDKLLNLFPQSPSRDALQNSLPTPQSP